MNSEDARKLLQAYVDGELDPPTIIELESHLATDPAARAACERLRELSAAIRSEADYHAAPARLAARLRASVPALPAGVGRRLAWPGGLAFGASLAAAVVVTWIAAIGYLRPSADERIAQEALASHVRATLASHLTDVASSDQHTVKPWLSARLTFSPPVTDLSAHGFELTGGRLDYVDGRPVATLVYKRRQHVIDVFVWPAPEVAGEKSFTQNGFNVSRFSVNGMSYWLVSDLNRNELTDLARLLAGAGRTP